MGAVLEKDFSVFSDALAASRAAAEFVATRLMQAITARGRASLVVPGGRSPVAFFYELSRISLPWSAVTVLLTDERCVSADHADSNERLVRERLLTWLASSARFVPVVNGADPRYAALGANRRLAAVPAPFDVVVLGMGEDGHTASLFPDSPQLGHALDPTAARGFVYVETPSAAQPRVTLNASALGGTRALALLIHGERKRAVFEQALLPGSATEFPIRLALHHATVPCRVFWSA